VAVGLTVFLGVAAIAIDLGHMMNVRTESQRVADLAALAGAGGLAQSPGNQLLAEALAVSYAAQNTVNQTAITLQVPADVIVDTVNARVRVWLRNTTTRGNAIPTIFARMVGINTVDVVTTAVAEASPAAGVNCVLPLALADRWAENTINPPADDSSFYDPPPGSDDVYTPWDPNNPSAPYTGYSDADIGLLMIIKPNQGGGPANQSWYYPWRPPGQQGGADYRANINSCIDPTAIYGVGQVVPTEPGAMIGPTMQGFNDLIDMDHSAVWNSSITSAGTPLNCVTDAIHAANPDPNNCRGSPRLRPMPMFDPTQAPDPGVKPFTFTNFASVFVSHLQGNNVYAVFAGFGGVTPASGGGSTAGPLAKVLRLIE
jgi:Flp pilus assembly protein TadG